MVIKDIKGNVLYKSTKRRINGTIEEAIKNGINLSGANLSGANLSGADLSDSILSGANLSGADLSGADLSDSILSGANLSGANLSGSILSDSILSNADLSDANLRGANLSNSILNDSILRNVDLSGANLSYAYLSGAKNVPNIPMACQENGEFIGWKKISSYKENYAGEFVVKLLIPEDAKRCSATSNKCRCDKAKVLEIRNISNGKTANVITNMNYKPCVYEVGKMVYPDRFDEDRWNECSNGIYFFVDEKDAEKY